MRVSDVSRYQFLQGSIQDGSSKLLALQKEISSGSTVNQPSDNPVVYQQQETLQTQLTQIGNQKTMLNDQKNKLSQYDGLLGGFESNIQQVRNLVQLASNATTDASAMPGIADQINTIIKGALGQANSDNNGQYLLGGTKSDAAPFVQNGGDSWPTSVNYVGDHSFPGIPVAEGQTLQVNLDGASVFQAKGQDFFNSLINIRDQVKQGKVDSATALQQLSDLEDHMINKRAETGSVTQYLSTLTTSLSTKETQTLTTLQTTSGANLPSAITQYMQTQTTQQAMYAVVSQTSKLSLVDYLK